MHYTLFQGIFECTHLGRRELLLTGPITSVVTKWINSNQVVQSILHKTGQSFEKMRAMALSDELSVQILTADHMYSEASDISFHDFEVRTEIDDFVTLEWFETFLPNQRGYRTDVFLCEILSRNFFQNCLSTASHSSNAFLNRKKLFSRK